MPTAQEILAAWSEVRAWLHDQRPDLHDELRPGADDETLAELAALGLPDTWRVWWEANDGGGPVLYDGWTWLPVRGVVDSVLSEYEALMEMAEHLEHESPPTTVGPVRAVWGHRDWIPFAVDVNGGLLCVDLAPLPGGVRGQVILVEEDMRRVLYDGPGSLFADCLIRMEMGVHPDDEPDGDTDEWAVSADDDGSVAAFEPPSKSVQPGPPKPPPPPPVPAEVALEPTVRSEAVLQDGLAEASIPLETDERSNGATVFVRQITGDVVGVRVPAGAWDGAKLRLPGLGGEGLDLVLVVRAAS